MDVDNILLAMEELERWKRRKLTLEKDLVGLTNEMKKGVTNELKKVNTQIDYYQDLICDMKKKFSPPTILEFAKR